MLFLLGGTLFYVETLLLLAGSAWRVTMQVYNDFSNNFVRYYFLLVCCALCGLFVGGLSCPHSFSV